MFLSETDTENIVQEFIKQTAQRLGIKNLPTVHLHSDPEWSAENHSFGMYQPESHELYVNLHNRHILDILRTTAHELVHCRQNEIEPLDVNAGDTGSKFENEAHAVAGVIMRDYAETHPEIFDDQPVTESSGYIPTEAQKNDPRFVMALTADVRPGATGLNANRIGTTNTDHISARPRPSRGDGRRREINAPLGPETPPTMPAGTVRVDVSDMYDWYKLGQHISNMKGLGQHDFGAGPPSSIISFGDEETEHKFIKDLAATGLDVTDIDPKDPKQPAGMQKIKTDPTYNVAEGWDKSFSPDELSILNQYLDDEISWQELKRGYSDLVRKAIKHFDVVSMSGAPIEFQFYDRLVQARDEGDLGEQGVAEGSVQDSFMQRLGSKLQRSGYTQTGTGTWSQGPDGRYVNITPLPDGQYGWELRRVNRRGKWYSGVDTSKAVVAIFKEFDIFSKHPVDESLAEDKLVESLRQEFELLEDEFIGEIKMSPTNLRAEAAKTGAIAGMEFEMIVPGMESEDPEQEPDYDQDERCRSIDDAVNFFHDGDYNSRREVERLRERMQNDFYEWLDDKLYQDWERNGEEYLEEWVPNNVDESEWNPDSLEGEARQEALEVFIANMHADPGSSDAFDEFREESAYDESDWLDAEDLDRMSGVENAYQITWPYWTMINSGEVDTDQVADEFSQAVGREVRVNTRYHQAGARPDPSNQFYVVEPDASLRGDDDSDKGLEFVSPPMPIDELLKDLNAIKAWAGRMGVYTNSSTGLHINISVPNYSRENLDFVKLALLMGDEYVLDQFGRSSNTYAKSALKIVKDNIRQSSGSAEALLTKMRGHMKDLATKAIHSGHTDKFTSINTKDGHIEFRSPGGDWLDENFDKIETTLLRFTVAMSAALNPEAYREEYQKKLYKLLTRDNKGDDTIKYFSDYVAGKIPKAALRSFVKQAQLDRKVKRGETGNQKMWWSVGRPGYFASVNVVASSKEEAIAKGKAEYPDWASAQDMTAKPLRPYEETPAQPAEPQGGNWGIWMRAADRFARVPGQTDLNVLLRFPSGEAAEQWIAQRRIENPNMRSDIEVREIEPAVQNTTSTDTGQIGIPGSTLDLQRQRRAAQSGIIDIEPDVSQNPPQSTEAPPGNQFSGQWKVVDGAGREVYRFRGVGNNQADANRIASTWARENSYTGALDVLPVMI